MFLHPDKVLLGSCEVKKKKLYKIVQIISFGSLSIKKSGLKKAEGNSLEYFDGVSTGYANFNSKCPEI
jgi:hypothetical protein